MVKAIFISLITIFSLCVQSSLAAGTITPVEGKYVIDVRTEEDWKAGHIEGAILIPHDQIRERISEYIQNKQAPIVVYCSTGRRSALAFDILKELGYENVENYGTYQEAAKKLMK